MINDPILTALYNQLSAKLQLDSQDQWDAAGNYISAPVLTLMDGVGNPSGVSPTTDFRKQDVEPLLQQANALLDRALADRAAFQQAGEKFATFTLDVTRKYATASITSDEQTDGRFTTPSQVSNAESSSQADLLTSLNSQQTLLTTRVNKSKNDFPFENARAGWVALLDNLDQTGKTVGPLKAPDGTSYGAAQQQNLAWAFATGGSQYQTNFRSDDLNAQAAALQGQIDSLNASSPGAQAQANWDSKNVQHLEDRAALEVTLLKLKMQMATIDYLLDFRQQMLSIGPRFRQTVVDAYERLLTVQAGMSLVYGRVDREALPAALSSGADVDSIVAWAMRTGTWLAALTRRTLNYVLPVSVKAAAEATTPGSWNAGQVNRRWTFAIPQATFSQQYFVRLRGLVGWVASNDPNALWTVNASLPTNPATWLYENGTSQTAAQDSISCIISGVTTRASRPVPYVVGTTASYNATPIGNWTVTISDAFDPNSAAVPDDIQLDLYLAVLPM